MRHYACVCLIYRVGLQP